MFLSSRAQPVKQVLENYASFPSSSNKTSFAPALDGLVVRVVAFGTEGRRFEYMKGYTPDQTCRETTGEFAPQCKPRYRAVAPPRVGPDP